MLMYGADPGPFGDNQDGHAAAQAAMLHQKLTEAEAQFMREGQEANAAKGLKRDPNYRPEEAKATQRDPEEA